MNYILDARTVTPHFPGIGRYVSSLLAELPQLLEPAERLTVLRNPGSLSNPGRADSRHVQFIDASASPFSLSQQWAIPPLLASGRVYHSPYYLMPYRPGLPTLLTFYDLIPLRLPQTATLRARLMFRLSVRLALRAAQNILCISSATRSDLLYAFPFLNPDRVTAVPLAPAPHFKPQPREIVRQALQQYQLPEIFALYIGINKPHKNLEMLIQAWAQQATDMPLVIGGAWDERYPEARLIAARLGLAQSGRVRFIGRIPESDLPALYSACSLFVFPSRFEGFGLPVIEAMACGAQVACSNTSSLPEVAGDAAWYFDPDQLDSMVYTLKQALSPHQVGKNVLEQSRTFTWHDTALATLEIYRSMAYNTDE